MKLNQWTMGLASAGVVSLASAVQAEEAQNQVMTALSSTTLSGFVDTSMIWKPGSGNGALPGRAFDGVGRVDGFNVHQINLTVEKPLDEGTWSAGYKAELTFGPDGAMYDASGQHIKQAYVALRAPLGNGLDFKVGAFDTIIGYEAFNSVANPNFSRSFGWQLEPTQHTGVLASYQVTDWLGIAGGVANTWHPGLYVGTNVRGESIKTYLGSVTITAPESSGFLAGGALYAGIVDGWAGSGHIDTTSYYVGGSLPTPIEGLSVGLAFDYVENFAGNVWGTGPENENWAWSLAGYVSFQASEKLKLNGRLDYLKGSDGTFYNSVEDGGSLGQDRQNELFAATFTVDYKLWENVVTRVEVRWDHVMTDDNVYDRTGGFYEGEDYYFIDGEEDAVTLALNVIYKF